MINKHSTSKYLSTRRVRLMKKKGLSAALAAIVILFVFSAESGAQNVHASGTQTRGSMGNSARLEGQMFYLPSPGTIISASSTGNGFWIQNASGNVVAQYWNANDSIGAVLQAGSYYIFPNLSQGQNFAKAFALFQVGGAAPPVVGGVPAGGVVWARNFNWNFAIQVPAGWVTKQNVSGEIAVQSSDPADNAFIEVHAVNGSGTQLEVLANQWESRVPYHLVRINEVVVNLSSGGHALVREYSGTYNGQPIGAGFLFTHTPGRYYVVAAVYLQAFADRYANLLGQCMGTLTIGN